MERKGALYFSGTSGLVLPLRQKDFPPEHAGASRLIYYASLFNSIEINSTFYKLPKPATVAKWAQSVPHDFRFTFKVPKSITHVKGLTFPAGEAERFMDTVAHIGVRRGCFLIQLPPSLTNERFHEIEDLLGTLKDLNDDGSWTLAIEFRHPTWYTRATYDLLKRYAVAMVKHDMPASATPLLSSYGPALYLRFHGTDGKYRGSYSDEALLQTSRMIKDYLDRGTAVYTYFNNTMGDAGKNLHHLNALVAQALLNPLA